MIFWRLLYLIVWIWQGPQNCLGWILSKGEKRSHIGPAGFKYHLTTWWIPCVVLGRYIFIKESGFIRYGYGKSTISVILGPFFLILVSIPSFLLLVCSNEFYYFSYWATKWSLRIGNKTKNYKVRF